MVTKREAATGRKPSSSHRGGLVGGRLKAVAAAIRRRDADENPFPHDNAFLAEANLPLNNRPPVKPKMPREGTQLHRVLTALTKRPASSGELASITGLSEAKVVGALDELRRYGWNILPPDDNMRFRLDRRSRPLSFS